MLPSLSLAILAARSISHLLRPYVTVAILAQGTVRDDATSQSFLVPPFQGFEQGLNKVSSFRAAPTQDPPPNAYLCHFQSAFCLTLPTPPMPRASKWEQILFSNALLLVLLQGIRECWESSPGHKHGRLVCCRYTTGAMTQAKEKTRHWLLAIAPLPSLLSFSQTTQRCSQTSDIEGIRTPAGRAQWISGPSPSPLGHTVMLVPASHIQHKVYTSRPHGHLSRVYTSLGQPQPSSRNFFFTKKIALF